LRALLSEPEAIRPNPHQSLRGFSSRHVLQKRQTCVVQRPSELDAFEFAVLAGLRAGQLARGCTPRVNGSDKIAVTAQLTPVT